MKQVGVYAIDQCPWTDEAGTGVFAVSSVSKEGEATTIALDLAGKETPEELLRMICKAADIAQEDIVFAWASPPCETYSRANWSNLSRGNNHRQPAAGFPPVEGEKGEKAD